MENKLEELRCAQECVDYEHFSTASVDVLLSGLAGVYGEEVRMLSIEVLKRFVEWSAHHKELLYLPRTDILLMYNPNVLRRMIEWAETEAVEPLPNWELIQIMKRRLIEADTEEQRVDWYYGYLMKTRTAFYVDTNDNMLQYQVMMLLFVFLVMSYIHLLLQRMENACSL